MIPSIPLRARIALGRAYAAAFGLGHHILRVIPSASWLGQQRHRLAERLRPQPQRKLRFLLAAFARAYPHASFVQIGANDGILEDPLREFVLANPWNGILVEPVPYLFERLRRNYPLRAGLILENAAIAARSGSQPFYYVPDSGGDADVPGWSAGLGSFSRDVVMKHVYAIPDLERRLVKLQVPCLSFEALCAKHHVGQLDLLHMDTEGYDFEILKMVDFERFRPRLLIYEHHHLSQADRAACLERLRQFGFEAMDEGLDVMCLNTRDRLPAHEPVFAAWEVLKKTREIPA
jgi:FkbM family methyltransferase